MNPGAQMVSDALLDPETQCYAHALNLCEVYYDFHRASGRDDALQAIADLTSLGVLRDAAMTPEVWQQAGALKASFRRISLADCIGLELARRLKAAILTADHHEFDALVAHSICEIRFIRSAVCLAEEIEEIGSPPGIPGFEINVSQHVSSLRMR